MVKVVPLIALYVLPWVHFPVYFVAHCFLLQAETPVSRTQNALCPKYLRAVSTERQRAINWRLTGKKHPPKFNKTRHNIPQRNARTNKRGMIWDSLLISGEEKVFSQIKTFFINTLPLKPLLAPTFFSIWSASCLLNESTSLCDNFWTLSNCELSLPTSLYSKIKNILENITTPTSRFSNKLNIAKSRDVWRFPQISNPMLISGALTLARISSFLKDSELASTFFLLSSAVSNFVRASARCWETFRVREKYESY